jgi:translation initiation factor eIF-2B subunit delta
MATAHNIPVLVCCETYKFCDKSPTDSFFHNELARSFGPFQGDCNQRNRVILGDEREFLKGTEDNPFKGIQQDDFLITPVIKYDVTPPELVTAVITDVDILPCTSVPVVLRVQENRKH